MKPLLTLALFSAPILISAQHVTVPSTCDGKFESGRDVMLLTLPYTYTQVLSIISSFKNLTWSGNPPSTVHLNGTDNTVGTARSYSLNGLHVVETLTSYSAPPHGPYTEVHTTALVSVPSSNGGPPLQVYIPEDSTTVTPICSGLAAAINMTAAFCATEPRLAAKTLHGIHHADAQNVGKLLGGRVFTSCAALAGARGTGTGVGTAAPSGTGMASAVSSGGGPWPTVCVPPYRGGASSWKAKAGRGWGVGLLVVVGGVMGW